MNRLKAIGYYALTYVLVAPLFVPYLAWEGMEWVQSKMQRSDYVQAWLSAVDFYNGTADAYWAAANEDKEAAHEGQ